jgi:hypothetical protein
MAEFDSGERGIEKAKRCDRSRRSMALTKPPGETWSGTSSASVSGCTPSANRCSTGGGRNWSRTPNGVNLSAGESLMQVLKVAILTVIVFSIPLSVAAEQFGSWVFGVETDTMTEKKTAYVIGLGDDIKLQIICHITESDKKSSEKYTGKRYLDVDFVTTRYLGNTVGIRIAAPVLFRIDDQQALQVKVGPLRKNVLGVIPGTDFIQRLIAHPARRLRLRLFDAEYTPHEYTIALEGIVQAVGLLKKDCGMTSNNVFHSEYEEKDAIKIPD